MPLSIAPCGAPSTAPRHRQERGPSELLGGGCRSNLESMGIAQANKAGIPKSWLCCTARPSPARAQDAGGSAGPPALSCSYREVAAASCAAQSGERAWCGEAEEAQFGFVFHECCSECWGGRGAQSVCRTGAFCCIRHPRLLASAPLAPRAMKSSTATPRQGTFLQSPGLPGTCRFQTMKAASGHQLPSHLYGVGCGDPRGSFPAWGIL